jgi:hypothetical protein
MDLMLLPWWWKLGKELRESAMDAHDGDVPAVGIAYGFLLDNPECFGFEEWPENMPQSAPESLTWTYENGYTGA